MSGYELGIDHDITIDDEGFVHFVADSEPFVFHINELTAAIHDDPAGKIPGILVSAMGCRYDEPKMFSKYSEGRYYVQSEYATGIRNDSGDDGLFFNTIKIVGTNQTIELIVDEIPYLSAGDEIVLCEKWNLKLKATKDITGRFFLDMLKANNIDPSKITRQDLDVLKNTGYFTEAATIRVTLEVEDSTIHFKG